MVADLVSNDNQIQYACNTFFETPERGIAFYREFKIDYGVVQTISKLKYLYDSVIL